MKRWFEALIYWHGKISDTNYIWFPYLFLKPAPTQLIPFHKSTLIMAPLWGLYMGLPYGLFFIYSEGWGAIDVIEFVAKFTLFFAIWFNLVTRPLWNARCRRLVADKSSNN